MLVDGALYGIVEGEMPWEARAGVSGNGLPKAPLRTGAPSPAKKISKRLDFWGELW